MINPNIKDYLSIKNRIKMLLEYYVNNNHIKLRVLFWSLIFFLMNIIKNSLILLEKLYS